MMSVYSLISWRKVADGKASMPYFTLPVIIPFCECEIVFANTIIKEERIICKSIFLIIAIQPLKDMDSLLAYNKIFLLKVKISYMVGKRNCLQENKRSPDFVCNTFSKCLALAVSLFSQILIFISLA